jgi:carboxypeptidase T
MAGALLAALPTSALAGELDFPEGYEAYHTYAEVEAFLDATVAAYPEITRKFSIGKSYRGREIWAIKISDNVQLDEDEPEILSVSLTHAREHITTEMNIYLIRQLTESYGKNSRISALVDGREIYIIPVLNPDGQLWDIQSGTFRKWRKNRQHIPGSSSIGIDLNRNFGFKWGCCGGSSGKPASIKYRGPEPWYATETRLLRDFINGRVVGGRQQIRAIFNWHSYGQLIMWPYGYTKEDVPNTMSADDHKALVAIGKEMARLNGYRAQQGSDLYIYDGDFMAWAYGVHRIIGFTLEMYPRHGAGKEAGGFYPPPSVLERETSRNRSAVLYLMEQADCPWRAAGLGTTHCGPLNDDFETGRGWQVNPAGSDTVTAGAWQRAKPQRTANKAGVKQRGAVTSGRLALVTGAKAGASANANDVDGGLTSVRSPSIQLGSGSGWRLRFSYYFAHNTRASNADYFRVSALAGGNRRTLFEQRGAATERNAKWSTVTLNLDAFAGQTIRLLIEAADNGADSLIEAAVDDVRVFRSGGSATQSDSLAELRGLDLGGRRL